MKNGWVGTKTPTLICRSVRSECAAATSATGYDHSPIAGKSSEQLA
ncbi:MAG: hypothetical protein WC749_08720 [Dehalococcoidia bacterium]